MLAKSKTKKSAIIQYSKKISITIMLQW